MREKKPSSSSSSPPPQTARVRQRCQGTRGVVRPFFSIPLCRHLSPAARARPFVWCARKRTQTEACGEAGWR